MMDEEGVPNMVSVHRVRAASGLRKHFPATAQTPSVSESKTRTTHDKRKISTSREVSKGTKSPSKYVVDRIVGHKGHGRKRRYIVRWYGYGLRDDTLEPEKISHFVS